MNKLQSRKPAVIADLHDKIREKMGFAILTRREEMSENSRS